MRTSAEITRIASGIYEAIVSDITTLSNVRKGTVEKIKTASFEEGLALVGEIQHGVEAILEAVNHDGVRLPAFLSKLTAVDDGTSIKSVHIRISSKLKAEVKFRRDADIVINDDFVANLADVYTDSLFSMFYTEMALENVKVLNDTIAQIIVENEIPYTFEFAVDPSTKAVVLSITDTNVVFNANIERAHALGSNSLFASGDSFNELIHEEAVTALVKSLKAVSTPVQLIKANIGLIKDLTKMATKRRASKLIRDSYHKQAKFLTGVNAGVGYFNETVTIDGEEKEIFSLVEKSVDGSMAVILKPFDVKTMMVVDYDVLGALA